jgi:hypothetical protein
MFDRLIRQVPDRDYAVTVPLTELPKPKPKAQILFIDIESTRTRILSVQIGDMMNRAIYYPKVKGFTISKERLFDYVRRFIKSNGGKVRKHVYLITHWSVAETRHIRDFLDYFTVKPSARGIHAQGVVTDREGKEHIIHFVDSITFFGRSLADIGESVGFPKISLDGLDGKSDDWWKTRMDVLLEKYPEKYEGYALRDVEVLAVAFDKWRRWFLEHYGLDLLCCRSISGIASMIFRHTFLHEPLAPTRIDEHEVSVKRKKGYVKRMVKETVFNGDRNLRYFAMTHDWGALNEASTFGLYRHPVAIYDIKASYGTMLTLQALPVADTVWFETPDLDVAAKNEGFVSCGFSFPAGTPFPCLPVPDENCMTLVYPLSGISFCTTPELRLALQMGATIQWVKAWVFTPGEAEKNHPLRRYAEHFLTLKVEGDKLTTAIAKDLLNVLVGKLIERLPMYSEEDMLKLRREVGAEAFRAIWRDKKQREKHKGTRRTGSMWAPECWGLITGCGRATIAELRWLNGSHHSVTDSAVVDLGIMKLPPYLEALGSGFEAKPEEIAEGVLSIRTRLFCLLGPDGLPKISAKARRGGIPSTHKGFIEEILTPNLKSGTPVVTTARSEHIFTIKDYLTDPTQDYGRSADKTVKISWAWDMKRRLKNWRVNPWIEYTESEPWINVDQFRLARLIRDCPKLTNAQKIGRYETMPEQIDLKAACFELYPATGRRKRPIERVTEVKKLRSEGLTIRQIAEKVGIALDTVEHDLRFS